MTTIAQKIKAHLRRRPTRDAGRRISVQERMTFTDAKLEAAPAPRNPDLHGLHWVGDLEPIGRALRQMTNVTLRDRLTKAIIDAEAPVGHPSRTLAHEDGDDPEQTDELTGGSMSRGPAGSYSTAGTRELGTAMTPADVQRMNSNYWDSVSNRYLARDSAAAIARPGTPRAVQLANSQFYSNLPKATTRRWGER
jgi:hypothetical protein